MTCPRLNHEDENLIVLFSGINDEQLIEACKYSNPQELHEEVNHRVYLELCRQAIIPELTRAQTMFIFTKHRDRPTDWVSVLSIGGLTIADAVSAFIATCLAEMVDKHAG